MDRYEHNQISGKTVILASAAGLALGGPFLALMGFSFIASLTLLLVTSPLLIIFSPLMFGAGCIFALAMAGFAVAAAMAFVGLSSIALIFRSFGAGKVIQLPLIGFGGDASRKFIESGEAGMDQSKDWNDYFHHRIQNPQENSLLFKA